MNKKIKKPWDLIAKDQQLVGKLYNYITVPSAVYLSKFKWITPNRVSIFVFILFLITTGFLLHYQFIFAAIGLLLVWYFDSIDGKIARWRGTTSGFGEWYDKITGYAGWVIFLAAYALIYNDFWPRLVGLIWLGSYSLSMMMSGSFHLIASKGNKEVEMIKNKKWYMRIFGEGIVPIVMIITALFGKPWYTLYFFGAGYMVYFLVMVFFQYRYLKEHYNI